uniref:Uncharacterized protein n=1 Tax=Syphacia muris TaxID=451379 RepID=A0A0N5AJY0_9BILA
LDNFSDQDKVLNEITKIYSLNVIFFIYFLTRTIIFLVFDMMQRNAKALEYADKVEKEREEDILRSPKAFFDLFKPTTTTTTTPKPMIERLLEPFLEPLTQELNKLNKPMNVNPSNKNNNFNANNNIHNVEEKFSQKMFNNNIKKLANEFSFLNPFEEIKPVQLDNPFTPNPLMSLFTATPATMAPILPPLEPAKPIHDRTKLKFIDPPSLPDPFYNPLFPHKKSKLMKKIFGDKPGVLFGFKPKA